MIRIKRLAYIVALMLLLVATFGAGWVTGVTGMGSAIDAATLPDRERQFTERMKNIALVGMFTIDGKERPGRPDRYDISSVEKVGEDRWRFNARMRHGNVDVTLPVAVTMRFVDDTPMILLTDLAIPALGTFTARVFFYRDRYAGTWQHGAIGGHMYGHIEPSSSN